MVNKIVLVLSVLAFWGQYGFAQFKQADKDRQTAETYFDSSHYDTARFFYEKAYRAVKGKDPVREANLCVDISTIDYMDEQYRRAINRCFDGLTVLRKATTPPDSVSFKLYSSLGTIYKNIYERDSAILYYRKADSVLAHRPEIEKQIPSYILYHFNNQGNWYFKSGNTSKSLIYLNKAFELAKRRGSEEDLAFIESNMAGRYDYMGDYSQALTHRLIANKLYRKQDIYKCKTLSGIARSLYNLKRYEEALKYLSESEKLLKTVQNQEQAVKYTLIRLNQLWLSSQCHRHLNQIAPASRSVELGLRLHDREIGAKGTLRAYLLTEKGQILEQRNQPEKALECYRAAVAAVSRRPIRLTEKPKADALLDAGAMLHAAVQEARVLKQLADRRRPSPYLEQAVDAYLFCVRLTHIMRYDIDAEQSQLLLTAQHYDLLPESVSVLFEAYQQQKSKPLRDELFTLFEQAHASTLNGALWVRSIKPKTIPKNLIDQEEKLLKKINEIRKKVPQDSSSNAQLNAHWLKWHQLTETFRRDYPAYYQLKYQEPTLSTEALQKKLSPQTAYLSYVWHQSSLYILVVTRDSTEVIRQPVSALQFGKQVADFRRHLYENPFYGNYTGMNESAQLYRHLIEPLRKWLSDKNRLIIARDWSFAYLPFEVLETGRKAHDYLARQYAISYAFSANLYFNRPESLVAPRTTLMVAPFARTDAVLKPGNQRKTLRPLRSSESESREIGGDLLLNANATKQEFLKADLERSVLYFATHAETDDVEPANSYIAFYPGEDDKLYTEEIYNLPLGSTPLVVLGACETGSGKTVKGEGILSLARAFAYAGCPSVVTTLWDANDETTSFLAVRLHHYLTQGMEIDEALKRGRQDFFDSPLFSKYKHPFYWANLTLIGNYHPVMEKHFWPDLLKWGLAAAVLVAVLIWQRKRIAKKLHYA